jgi:hypothetical protein
VGDELESEVVGSSRPGGRPGRARRWIGAGVLAVAVVIGVFLIAESGGGGGGPLNAIAKAAEVTQRVPGGRAEFTAEVTVAGSPEGLTETGTIVFDNSGRSSGSLTVKGHSTGKEFTAQMVGVGTTSYISSEALASISGGKKWAKMDLSDAVRSSAGSSSAAGESPEEGLKVLENVEDATEVGPEEIDGVSTTHWRGTLPAADEIFGVKVHYSEIDTDVWIDAKDRVRRMTVSLTGPGIQGAPTTTTKVAIDYFDFGQVPAIEAPPADEVFDATSLIESNFRKAAGAH